jgi:hypothetical protein
LTTDSFASLNDLLTHAGNKKSPTDLKLRWFLLLEEPLLAMASVTVMFHTDARKETKEFEILSYPLSTMEYEISGIDRDWVENVASDINPIMESTRLRGIYKPLMIFRNRQVIMILSWTLGVIAQLASLEFVSGIFSTPDPTRKFLYEALSEKDIAKKFDLFIIWLTTPSPSSPFYQPLVEVGLSIAALLIVVVLGWYLLPMLIPRSGILIGLERENFQYYQNAFKFIVFTILVAGVGSILIVNLIEAIL